jgi:hypothetical protein
MSLGKTIKDLLAVDPSPPEAGPHSIRIYEWPTKQ